METQPDWPNQTVRSYNLTDVLITIEYTACESGDEFGSAVMGVGKVKGETYEETFEISDAAAFIDADGTLDLSKVFPEADKETMDWKIVDGTGSEDSASETGSGSTVSLPVNWQGKSLKVAYTVNYF